MPGCIDDRQVQVMDGQPGRLGEDRDAALPFQVIIIQVSVTVIHPAQAAKPPGPIEHGLRQGGLARVNMGEHPYHRMFDQSVTTCLCE